MSRFTFIALEPDASDYQVSLAGLPGTFSRIELFEFDGRISDECDQAAKAELQAAKQDREQEREYAQRSR